MWGETGHTRQNLKVGLWYIMRKIMGRVVYDGVHECEYGFRCTHFVLDAISMVVSLVRDAENSDGMLDLDIKNRLEFAN